MARKSRARARLSYRTQDDGIARDIVLKAVDYFPVEQVQGWPLISAAVVALFWANSPWADTYQQLWTTKLSVGLGTMATELDLKHVVNELLMPVFFFLVGLEVKHELTMGELSTWKKAAMPACVGLGGMLVPAAIYLGPNVLGDGNPRGWAVPIATDIAFALAILVLLGDRVPAGLKALTLAFAAVDDIGGVLAIALFYSHGFSPVALGITAGLTLVIVALTRLSIRGVIIYTLLGLGVFLAMRASGVHTTIAGVVLGFIVPARPKFSREDFITRGEGLLSELQELYKHQQRLEGQENLSREKYSELEFVRQREESILARMDALTAETESPVERAMVLANPWVSYLVLPMFALANSGLQLTGSAVTAAATSAVAWGVFGGLLFGKPIGILLAAYLAERASIASLPKNVDWWSLTGMSFLAGIGFTVSLFIAELAFTEQQQLTAAKMGILAATLLATLLGAATLYFRPGTKQ